MLRLIKYFGLYLFVFCSFVNYGQSQKKIDSLTTIINNLPNDSNKVNTILILSNLYNIYSSKENINYLIEAQKLSKDIAFDNGIKKTSSILINNLYYKEMYDVSLKFCLDYIEYLEKNNFTSDRFKAYNILANLYTKQGEYDKAMSNYNLAKKYYLAEKEEIKYANVLTNISILYSEKKDYDSAMFYSVRALEIYKQNNNSAYMANCVLSIAEVYLNNNDFDRGKKRAFEALDLYSNMYYKHGMCNCYFVIGQLYNLNHNTDSALKYFNVALLYSDTLKMNFIKRDCYHYISNTYYSINKFKEAYDYNELFQAYQDSSELNTVKGKMLEMEVKYDISKKEDQLKEQEFEIVANNKQRNYLLMLIFVIFILFFISFKAYKNKKKSNELISEQKKLVDEKQKEVYESINYAKRIQFALLANLELVKNNIPEHFVLFKPKDIVSGDFYWATEHNNMFYIAVCDSTGHGVPGAFMSLLNIGFLNEAVKEKDISKPNEILNYVRKRLIDSIGNDGQQDGMDAILVCFDKINKTITYAAANNEPILISVNNLESEIIELPKDKMPVGKGERIDSFTLQAINIKSGDTLYLYTDGYADQFGGPKGKKFKYKQLNELLLKNSNLSMSIQMEELMNTFMNWKGDLEQVDDVCVIGIKI